MINFTIDTSIFALPLESDDRKTELKNIQNFITNMFYLQFLEKCSSVTVNYMNNIPKILLTNKINPKDLLRRIKEIKNYAALINYNPDILDFFQEKYKKINGSYIEKSTQEKIFVKGKIGIYENIPDRETDPAIKYRYISYNKSIYPKEYRKKLSNNFELYLGFLAEINNAYFAKKDNYIVINADTNTINAKVTLCFDNFRKSEVNIIGIQKADELCPANIYNNVDDVITEIKKYNTIISGSQTTILNIKKNMGFDSCNNNVNKLRI